MDDEKKGHHIFLEKVAVPKIIKGPMKNLSRSPDLSVTPLPATPLHTRNN